MHLDRLAEAKATYEQALGRMLDAPVLHYQRYAIAFLEGDATEMERQVAWSAGKPGADNILLHAEANTEVFSGHIGKARELYKLAAESALRAGQKEVAAGHEMLAAFAEAEFGNAALARSQTVAALALAPTRNIRSLAALVFARTGDSERAHKMTDELEKQNSVNTEVVDYWLPTIRAAIEINGKNPAKAIEILQTAAPIELGERGQLGVLLYPIYVRGQAYLALRQGTAAAAEFQKLIDHRGLVLNQPIGALAHLGLARAYALQGDSAKANTVYQDFLTLWKDADPDVPVLKKAKAEYARLQ
jgi:tetratricopeptide (TPR) repeat protein